MVMRLRSAVKRQLIGSQAQREQAGAILGLPSPPQAGRLEAGDPSASSGQALKVAPTCRYMSPGQT